MEQLAPRLKAATASEERFPIMERCRPYGKKRVSVIFLHNDSPGGFRIGSSYFRFQVSMPIVFGSVYSISVAVKTRTT